MSRLKEHFINSFVTEVGQLNGTDFEYLCRPILSLLIKEEVLHKGHNLYCKPVGYTADFISDNYEIIGQCGTEPNYFDDFNKPIKDIERCIINHKKCKNVYLFANQRAPGGRLTDLDTEVTNKWINPKVKIVDAEQIANTILSNISNTAKVEEVLKYLHKTYEYYRILPQTNKLPSFKTKYFERKEEDAIIQKIRNQDYIQVYGISGIGKTEISISIANSLNKEFESIIWLDGDSFIGKTLNLSSVQISKFNNALNLDYFLQEFKILLIVDNLNANVNELIELFKSSNKHKSKCIITSLQRDLPLSNAYNLSFLEIEIANNILYNSKIQPKKEQVDLIVNEVLGYPLVLNLIISSVEVDDFSWDEIIDEIENLKNFPDSKNIKLSERIIGKFTSVLNTELQWIKKLNNRKTSRHFLAEVLSKKSIVELEKRSLIRIQDSFFFDTHQLILDSIKSEISNIDNRIIFEGLKKYLTKYNEIKSIEYYRFMLNHNDFIQSMYDSLSFDDILKKEILYALIQTKDSFNSPEWFLQQLNSFPFEAKTNYYDLLLFIEKLEIELFQIDKNSDTYNEKSGNAINDLSTILQNTEDINSKIVLHHHIGKFYLKIKDDSNAIMHFSKVLKLDLNADYSRLQLARLYVNKKEIEKAEIEIAYVFSKEIDINNQSLSILLSFYELLARNEFQKTRSKYIDRNIDFFIKVILSSLDSSFEHPYIVVEKLSSHLSYIMKEAYDEICETLPFPSNIDNNRNLRIAYAKIKLSQYKMLKYSNNDSKDVMEIVLSIAEKYFKAIDFQSDFERKQLLDLYIVSEQYDKALEFSQTFEEKDEPFYLQNLSKILRAKMKFHDAQAAIDKALLNGKDLKPFYIAAFLNDKAEIIHLLRDNSCIEILQQAIEKQNTQKTKEIWILKKQKWTEELK